MKDKTEQDKRIIDLFQHASTAILKRKGATAAGFLQQALRGLEREGSELDSSFYLTMLFSWADLFWSVDRPDQVLAVFDLFESQSPGDPQIALHRAIALFHLARFEEAQGLLSDLEERGYPAADLHFFLGCLAERISREATAMAHFERAAMLEPERYIVPAKHDEKVVRNVLKKLIGRLSGPLRDSLSRSRLVVEPLPSDSLLKDAAPRLDPLALTLVDVEKSEKIVKTPMVRSIHLFMKNIEKSVLSNEELEERLSESLTHELSHIFHSDEDTVRGMFDRKR